MIRMRIEADWFVKDKTSAAEGLRRAIAYGKEIRAEEIHFSKGEYILRDFITIRTESIAHDDGCGNIHEKDCHLVIDGVHGLRLVGEVNEDGSPATVLSGYHPYVIQTLYPSLLWVTASTNLSVSNLAFRRIPTTVCNGIVEAVGEGHIQVRVSPDLFTADEMGAYCMNRFDVNSKTLLGESLTYGFGYDIRFKRTGSDSFVLKDENLARKVKAGEGLSWHAAGKTDFLVFFGEITGLTISNVRIYNTNSFALLTENCCDIRAERLCIRPEENQIFTGPRDGWKIYRCSGHILVDQCHFEGLRMDAQNIHSNYMVVEKVVDAYTLVGVCKYAPISLKADTGFRIYYKGRTIYNRLEEWAVIGGRLEESRQSEGKGAARVVGGMQNHVTCYKMRFKEAFGKEMKPLIRMEPLCWEPESYTCRNSVFRNIAGVGNLIRCSHVLIENNNYENMMNAGVLIGAELDTHCESGHADRVLIRNNRFHNIGFKPRYREYGCACIAVKSQGFEGPFNRRIRIENNRFENSGCAIELNDCREVVIKNNEYYAISNKLKINETSVDKDSVMMEGDEK